MTSETAPRAMPMIPSRRSKLLFKLSLLRPALSAAGARVLYHDDPARAYPVYISAMHGISRAAVPLMECAIRAIDERHGHEDCAGPLREYWTTHIPEESGHDDWALEDLEV